MDSAPLFEMMLNENIHAFVMDDYKIEFIRNGKLFGFVSFEGKVLTPYVKNICQETGRYEHDLHDWAKEMVQWVEKDITLIRLED